MFCLTKILGKYCAKCGAKVPESEEQWIITDYFRKGFPYKDILSFLAHSHGINISLRTLKTRLKEYGLSRRSDSCDDQKLDSVLLSELQGPSQQCGYRSMWSRLKLFHGMFTSRDVVMRKMREMDPEGCKQRKKRRLARRRYINDGPNDVWHLDRYDKLKPFGFPIHGCIDGHSRKIIWLRVVPSNNNPVVIANLYLDAVQSIGGCPKKIRNDCGSENVVLAAMQCFLRRNHDDDLAGEKSHVYGPSHSNQRIEAWWSFYKRNRSAYIINAFKEMVDNDEFNAADKLLLSLIRYCFVELLQKDLNEIVEYWNTHYIRKSRHDTVPGRPDVLYYLPDANYASDQIKTYEERDIEEMKTNLHGNQVDSDDEEESHFEYFEYLKSELQIQMPTNWDEAKQMYTKLRSLATP